MCVCVCGHPVGTLSASNMEQQVMARGDQECEDQEEAPLHPPGGMKQDEIGTEGEISLRRESTIQTWIS